MQTFESQRSLKRLKDMNEFEQFCVAKNDDTNFSLATEKISVVIAYKAMLNNRGTDLKDVYSVSPPRFDRWKNPHN